MTTLTEQERKAVITACKYAMQDYSRFQSLPGLNIMNKEIKPLKSGLDKLSTAPKYVPCRPFKAGDIVEFDTHGRDISASMEKAGVTLGKRYVVTEDENKTGYVPFIGDDGIEHHAIFFWLKLVQPVEEMGPYMVKELKDSFIVYHDCTKIVLNDTSLLAKYMKASHPNAKAAAQAECDRLNAEYRKEQEND